jgi:hypothetical protein
MIKYSEKMLEKIKCAMIKSIIEQDYEFNKDEKEYILIGICKGSLNQEDGSCLIEAVFNDYKEMKTKVFVLKGKYLYLNKKPMLIDLELVGVKDLRSLHSIGNRFVINNAEELYSVFTYDV